jgi:hypothetical protein
VGNLPLRPDIIKVFCEEMPKRVCVATNATFPLLRYKDLYFYWVSIDGTEKVHDSIRGQGSYQKTRQNIISYVDGSDRQGKPAWKDIWLTMTINSLNHSTINDLVDEWRGVVNKIGFQFHTSFTYEDKLWLPFGGERDSVVDNIADMKIKYPDFVINSQKQLSPQLFYILL